MLLTSKEAAAPKRRPTPPDLIFVRVVSSGQRLRGLVQRRVQANRTGEKTA